MFDLLTLLLITVLFSFLPSHFLILVVNFVLVPLSLSHFFFSIFFQEQKFQEETEIDKQEREIIESLEREEKEHKKYLSSVSPSGRF